MTLIHRGPDQLGLFRSHSVSLGATRLKVIDLESGDQPFTTADGDATIVFNGEIYNHRELRDELQRRGHRFRSNCDTETALYSFVEWGTDCFKRFRGMFAMAVWTHSTRTLVLARDRIGIKPLYIARQGGNLYFGSELKAILVHPEIERHLSLSGLDCFLSLNYVPSPWTLVEGIEKLPSGTWLKWHDGKVSSDAYWRIPNCDSRERSLEEAKEELDVLLKQSIREQLVSDVPLGVWLSGGIDSSTILHYAASQSSAPLKTFSILFRQRSLDERRYIQEVTQKYGTEHFDYELGPDLDLRDAIEEFAFYSDEPSADAGALPVWYLSRLCRTKTTVALSGEGADELFGGYLTYRADQIASRLRKLPAKILMRLSGLANAYPVSDEKIGFEYKMKRLFEGCLMEPARAHAFWNGTFLDSQKQSMIVPTLPGAFENWLSEIDEFGAPGAKRLERFFRFDQKYYLADDILVKTDRMSMAHSVEVRPPFLDHRIVQFAATLPQDMKIKGAQQKVLLRELMKDKLPSLILRRKKMGFDIPTHEWLRGPLRDMLEETLAEGMAAHGDLFQRDVVRKYIDLHLERRLNLGYHLWGLMILFLWMKKWGIQSASSSSRESLLSQPAAISS